MNIKYRLYEVMTLGFIGLMGMVVFVSSFAGGI